MKKEPAKTTRTTETQLLELLKRVLPKATHDAQLAGKIYAAIENELKTKARTVAFEKFCNRVELPDLEPKSVQAVKAQLTDAFGAGDVTLKPDRKEKTKAGQKALRDRVERIFPEFIARVPSGALTEVGLKRHYKTPEPLKVLRVSKAK